MRSETPSGSIADHKWANAIKLKLGGVFIVGATTWAMSHAQRAFTASVAVLAYAMEPLFAALFAAAFLHDSLSAMQVIGGALIVGANIMVALRS